jgi:hypothetical protein
MPQRSKFYTPSRDYQSPNKVCWLDHAARMMPAKHSAMGSHATYRMHRRAEGYTEMQGFVLSKPLPVDEIDDLLRTGHAAHANRAAVA